MTDDRILTHDLDGDPFTCATCSNEPAALAGNAHTLYDYLAATCPEPEAAEWLDVIEASAAVHVAMTDDVELYCWCGHGLHYPDCACDDGLACAKRWAVEMTVPDEETARARFVCPGETAEHWAELAMASRDGSGWLVTCGHCGMLVSMSRDGATTFDVA